MRAGAIRRSLKPVAQIVLWQVEDGAIPSIRQMATVSGARNSRLPSVEVLNDGVGFPWSGVAGTRITGNGGWRRSITPPQLRWASNSSALRSEVNEEEQIKQKDSNADVSRTDAQIEKKGLVRSNYWGITPKVNLREDGTAWPWNCFRPTETYTADIGIDLHKHHEPKTWEDKLAYWAVKALRLPTDLFFKKRYGCRAMMLETVAGVPGMVGGMTLHLRSLRRFEHSGGWIKALLEEAENERMHLMTFMEVAKPVWYERALVVATQGVFFNAYFLLYLLAPRVAHRFTGYLEEEAIYSYTKFLEEIDRGNIENIPAPSIAIDYWRLPKDATLRDVVIVVRADEAHHRDVNHYASDIRKEGKQLHESPAPVDYH